MKEENVADVHLLSLIQSLEKEIELSQEKTRLILSSLPLALVLVKDGAAIDVVNRVVQEMFGYSRKDLYGKSISLLFPDLDTAAIPASCETMARRANGERFATQVSTVTMTTPDGDRLFIFANDISKRYELEQIKRDFIAMVSHDLRSPLMSISGTLELSRSGKLGELSALGNELMEQAEKSLNRVLDMIAQLIEVEKLEGQNALLDIQVNNLSFTLKEATADVERLAEQKRISIESRFPDSVYAAYDNDKIHRILVNLLANAIKFSPEESVITVEHRADSACHEVVVRDCGRGVPPEERERIFSKYAQVFRSDSRQEGGTGLGLAICKTLVEAHGGAIGVGEGTGGRGSAFWFTLPLRSENQES
ncbi:MAG: PAS domain S-box protein [Cyanobacteria bacterium HKST-UBA02]|nr:PAS domain S-box protein [Cyanobacteria bacterium HKST-UBA02]